MVFILVWFIIIKNNIIIFKSTCPEELKAFKAALKALKAKMAPMVYELGFLWK